MYESIITGVVAIAVCMINNAFQNRATAKKNEKTQALIEYKLEELTKKVEAQNNIIARIYKLEETTALHEEKLKVANHRIDDLERKN